MVIRHFRCQVVDVVEANVAAHPLQQRGQAVIMIKNRMLNIGGGYISYSPCKFKLSIQLSILSPAVFHVRSLTYTIGWCSRHGIPQIWG